MKPCKQKKFAWQDYKSTGALLGLLAASALLGASFSAQAELAISGQLSYNIADRDSEDDLVFQRNGFSESVFRLVYSKPLEQGRSLDVVQEIGIAEGEGALDSRRQEVIFKANFGSIRFGQGNDAGDGNLNGDLSGTAVIQPIASQAAALDYSGANYNGFDPARGERIRYDSPKFGDSGVASFQLGEQDETEIALRYNVDIDGGQLRIGAFITNTGSDVDQDSSGILIAYGMENGLNFALVSSSRDNSAGAQDGDFSAIKIGFKTGRHAFSFISGTSENPGNAVETDSTGIAYVFTMEQGIEVFAATNEFDSDNDAADEDFLIAGTRIKF